ILPQIARLMAPRTKSQQLLPATMLWGSLLLINADTVARTILAPKELATSAVLLAISGPLFAVMLLKGSRHATT
ncbi:MAG: iron chelate uptake ABC transporter family permease subunit, partial [Weissella cibaria]